MLKTRDVISAKQKVFGGKKACAILEQHRFSIYSEFLPQRCILQETRQKHNIQPRCKICDNYHKVWLLAQNWSIFTQKDKKTESFWSEPKFMSEKSFVTSYNLSNIVYEIYLLMKVFESASYTYLLTTTLRLWEVQIEANKPFPYQTFYLKRPSLQR